MSNITLKVSVIVPVYNGAETIARCVESLLCQDYPAENLEIIVVDNCSTDATAEIVKRYPVSLCACPERGPAAARNYGIARSEAEIVAFTDADCVASPNWISRLVQPYQDPEISGVGGCILSYEHPEQSLVELFLAENAPLINYVSGEAEYLPHLYTANASFRRLQINQVGGFNPKLVTIEDVELSWRIQCETGARLAYAPDAVIYHHHRSTLKGLARQYRQYGFGEIILDTLYKDHQGYPRTRRHQVKRILAQVAVLPKYAASLAIRKVRRLRGTATTYQAVAPGYRFVIEGNNILGKIDGLIATRFMTDAAPVFEMSAEALISRYFPRKKE